MAESASRSLWRDNPLSLGAIVCGTFSVVGLVFQISWLPGLGVVLFGALLIAAFLRNRILRSRRPETAAGTDEYT
jgi:hypothetical protein